MLQAIRSAIFHILNRFYGKTRLLAARTLSPKLVYATLYFLLSFPSAEGLMFGSNVAFIPFISPGPGRACSLSISGGV